MAGSYVDCKSVGRTVSYSRAHMSLDTDVSQSQVTLEISPEWQLLPSHIGGT